MRSSAGSRARELGFLSIDDHADALREDIDVLTNQAYLGLLQEVAGFVYDVESGELEDVLRWSRATDS